MEGQGESNLALPLLTGASKMDQHFWKVPVVQRKKLTLLAGDLPAMSASGSPAHLGPTRELADVFLGNTKQIQGSLTQDRGCVRQQNLGGPSNLCPSTPQAPPSYRSHSGCLWAWAQTLVLVLSLAGRSLCFPGRQNWVS